MGLRVQGFGFRDYGACRDVHMNDDRIEGWVDCSMVFLRWTPHPVIVTTKDNKDYIRVLLGSYYMTIIGWGGPSKVFQINPQRC